MDTRIKAVATASMYDMSAAVRSNSENAYAAALEPKELYEVADAEHIDLYDYTDRIPFEKLAEFFGTNLK